MQVICIDFYGKKHPVDTADLIDRHSAYGVYIADGKVLLIKDPRSLRWELPGGGVEGGESIHEGLAREFTEEAGLTIVGSIKLLTEWAEYFFDVPTNQGWRSKRQFYVVPGVSGKILAAGNGDDSATAELIPIKQISSLKVTPKIRKVIEQSYRLTQNS